VPYILSPNIRDNSPGMWNEGNAFCRKTIYSLNDSNSPPVNYEEYIFRSHSLTHMESPLHTQLEGKSLDYFINNKPEYFFGRTLLIKLEGFKYEKINDEIYHWEISKKEIEDKIIKLSKGNFPGKVLITSEEYPENNFGFHDPNYVLTLSKEAAEYLTSFKNFHLYGNSWKSTDFSQGKRDRPIHNIIFSKGLILENLKLKNVPEGNYFINTFPIPIVNSSESPVIPVLYNYDEIQRIF
jgi:kynurenine formamidase